MKWLRSNAWNRLIYAGWAPVYDVLAGFGPLARARRKALGLLSLAPGEEVLVVGVGTGSDLPLLPAGVKVTGVDLSAAMLRRARRKPLPEGCEVTLHRADAMDLPFADGRFDAVVLSLILSVVADGAGALREAVRVTRGGGRLLVFDKFLPEGGEASLARRGLNLLTSVFGTDINRRFAPMMDGLRCRVVRDEPAMASGAYRAILIEKTKE